MSQKPGFSLIRSVRLLLLSSSLCVGSCFPLSASPSSSPVVMILSAVCLWSLSWLPCPVPVPDPSFMLWFEWYPPASKTGALTMRLLLFALLSSCFWKSSLGLRLFLRFSVRTSGIRCCRTRGLNDFSLSSLVKILRRTCLQELLISTVPLLLLCQTVPGSFKAWVIL